MFASLWNKITSVGVKNNYDEKLIKRITLTNQFSAIALSVFLLSGINNYLLGDAFSAIIIELFVFVCFLGILFNYFGLHKLATSFLLISISAAIFYFDSYSGLESGTFLYYFPLILAIAFLFDVKHKKEMLLHFLLPLFFLAINIFTHYTLFRNENLSLADRHQMFLYNLLFSTASIGFFVYLTLLNNIKINEIFEQRINERKATEKAIKQALEEKDILLAEIHHRVKNNLAIIASLFNLQLSSIKNEEAKEALMESKNRVKSMALIHDRLYKSQDMTEIDFENYTKELIDEIKYSYPTLAKNIEIKATVSHVKLNVNNAIPCGLILNELLTNCYKHAFIGRQSGVITIDFTGNNGLIKLKVKDNGVGLRADYTQSDSLGMVVIQSLSEQLDGKHKFTVDNGTCFELMFEQV